jgi:excisionase family DNA binding protein
MGQQLLTPSELAEYLRVPLRTLYQWRYERRGPRAIRVGRHLRYRWRDVERWLEEREREGAAT